LTGKTYADCAGTYGRSNYKHNGQYIWDRERLGYGKSTRFVFWNSPISKWCITGSQWRVGFVGKNGKRGAFICSARTNSETPWYNAYWGKNVKTQPVIAKEVKEYPKAHKPLKTIPKGFSLCPGGKKDGPLCDKVFLPNDKSLYHSKKQPYWTKGNTWKRAVDLPGIDIDLSHLDQTKMKQG
jgi:hypothetical protein